MKNRTGISIFPQGFVYFVAVVDRGSKNDGLTNGQQAIDIGKELDLPSFVVSCIDPQLFDNVEDLVR